MQGSVVLGHLSLFDMDIRDRAQEILFRLRNTYTERGEFIEWSNPLELVIGIVLSAQCTDKRVNMVTAELFNAYTSPEDYANASLTELQEAISSITFYKAKSRYLKKIGQQLITDFDGEVPQTMKELMSLPGVGYKSASLIMAKAYGQMEGVAVDTHVKRVAPRLGLTTHSTPAKISTDLEAIVPQKDYLDINEYLIMHGRAICAPRKPKCGECVLQDICPAAEEFLPKE